MRTARRLARHAYAEDEGRSREGRRCVDPDGARSRFVADERATRSQVACNARPRPHPASRSFATITNVFLIESVSSIRKFNRVMFAVGVLFGLGWALLTNPLASRISGTVSVLVGLLGGLGGFRIEALQRPRRLAAKPRRALLERLRQIPVGSIEVRVCASDLEAIDLSMQVVTALSDAGWNARHALTVTHPTRAGFAIGVIGTDQEAVDRARRLVQAFSVAGLDIDEDPEPIGGPTIELVGVLIGPKPDPLNRPSRPSPSQVAHDNAKENTTRSLNHMESHALQLGKLMGNLQSLEMGARMAIQKLDPQSSAELPETLLKVKQGDWVGISPLTNKDDLRQTIAKYNRHAPLDCRLEVGPIVRLRDALAHGRVFAFGRVRQDATLRLIKFDRNPKDSRIHIALVVDMTADWFSTNVRILSASLQKVARALDYATRDLSTLN